VEVQHEAVLRAFLEDVSARGVTVDRGEESLTLQGLVGTLPIRWLVLGAVGSEMPMPIVRGESSWSGVLRPWAVRLDVGDRGGPADCLAALRRGTTLWQTCAGAAGRSAVLLTAPPFDVLSRRDIQAFRHWAVALVRPDPAEARRAVSRVALRASGASPALRAFGAASLRVLSAFGPWDESPRSPGATGPVADAARRSGLFDDLDVRPRLRSGPFLRTTSMVGRNERLGLRLLAVTHELRLPSSLASKAHLLPSRWSTVRLSADRSHQLEALAPLATSWDDNSLWWWVVDEEADALHSALSEVAAHFSVGRDGPYR